MLQNGSEQAEHSASPFGSAATKEMKKNKTYFGTRTRTGGSEPPELKYVLTSSDVTFLSQQPHFDRKQINKFDFCHHVQLKARFNKETHTI